MKILGWPKITAKSAQDRYFFLHCRCNLRCVGYLVPQYEMSTQYSFYRSDLKCHRDGCVEQCSDAKSNLSQNLIIRNDSVRVLVTFEE